MSCARKIISASLSRRSTSVHFCTANDERIIAIAMPVMSATINDAALFPRADRGAHEGGAVPGR